MQGNTGQQGNQGGNQKQGGLSWTQPPQSAKSISQVTPPPMSAKSSAPHVSQNASQKKSLDKVANKNTGNVRTAGVFAAGVIVGLIIGWGWFSLGVDGTKVADTPSDASPTTETDTTSGAGVSTGSPPAIVASSGALSLLSPQDAGLRAIVSQVSVAVPTWVVVYDNIGGKPGNALGAAMFFPGETAGDVQLLRGTLGNQTYFAGEYVDNGDHIFSKQSDTQVMSITGSPLLVEFRTK